MDKYTSSSYCDVLRTLLKLDKKGAHKTRKLNTIKKALHFIYDVDKLYIKRKGYGKTGLKIASTS